MRNGKAVVLVVEDDFLVRMGAVEIVLNAGYEVLEAGSADEAIQILTSRNDIELVFTDVQMPGTMDGLELARYIEIRWPNVNIIVTSGTLVLQTNTLPPGAGFFAKPYVDDTVTDEIALMLSVSLLFGNQVSSL